MFATISHERSDRGVTIMSKNEPDLQSRIQWLEGSQFKINETMFELDTSMDRTIEYQGRMCLAKGRRYIDAYFEHVDLSNVRTIVELGVFRGGSTAFFNELISPEKLIGIDLQPHVSAEFDAYMAETTDRASFISMCTSTLQDDRDTVNGIMDEELGGRPIDLVIDDCSHLYEQTKVSFEILFPRLSLNGVYVIEDWSWAHSPNEKINELGDRALSDFVFELQMLAASQPGWITKIVILPFIVFVYPGPHKPDYEFSVSDNYRAGAAKLHHPHHSDQTPSASPELETP